MGKVVVKVAVWFVIFIILMTLGLEMISAPNTIEKWDGTVPTVITGGNTSTFLDLSKIRK